MWPPTRRHRFGFDAKYIITTLVAISALAISAYNTYVANRHVDDASVVLGSFPPFGFIAKDSAFAVWADESLTFINSGTRGLAINAIYLEVTQPYKESEPPPQHCDSPDSASLVYDTDPFVLEPARMLPRPLQLRAKSKPTKEDLKNHPVEGGYVEVALTDISKKEKKHPIRLCIEVLFTTQDQDFNSTVIWQTETEFSDDDDNTFLSGVPVSPHAPISLIKNSHSMFDWPFPSTRQ
jgi:hypothetical protein